MSDTLLLTLAIPHYKHSRYLQVVLQSIFEQTSNQFEILVSNDNSLDESDAIIPTLLEKSGRHYSYHSQSRNLGYDGNVRFCLRSAKSPYVMLLGNDDAIANARTVQALIALIQEIGSPDVAVTNYCDWGDRSRTIRRVCRSGIIGGGPSVALANFRLFSFVSGLVFKRELALIHETGEWDRSVFYQIYLACRILAAGGRLGGLDVTAVAKDVKVDGRGVPSYANKYVDVGWSFAPRDSGLLSVIRVTEAALRPYIEEAARAHLAFAIIRQVLRTSYAFWLIEYRRVANWAFSLGLARGMRPAIVFEEYPLTWKHRGALRCNYFLVTIVGLAAPMALMRRLAGRVAMRVRRKQQDGDSVLEMS